MRTFAIALLLTLSACSSLVVRPSDTAMETTGKVTARVLLMFPTLFVSEMVMLQIERDEEAAAYANWYHSLTPEQQAAEDRLRGGTAPVMVLMTPPTPMRPAP